MSYLVHTLQVLIQQGEIVLSDPPTLRPEDRPAVEVLLADLFADWCLHLAGPRLEFDPVIGCRAAEFVLEACWTLVNGFPARPSLSPHLQPFALPGTAKAHASADLTFRFLPGILRRGIARQLPESFTQVLRSLLRAWPLSGVLAGLSEGPTSPLHFDNHVGLQWLYAERFAQHESPAWLPSEGPLRQCIEMVYLELGRPLPLVVPSIAAGLDQKGSSP